MEVKELYSKLNVNEQNYVRNSLIMWSKRKPIELEQVTRILDTEELDNLIEEIKKHIEEKEETDIPYIRYTKRDFNEMSDEEFYKFLKL